MRTEWEAQIENLIAAHEQAMDCFDVDDPRWDIEYSVYAALVANLYEED